MEGGGDDGGGGHPELTSITTCGPKGHVSSSALLEQLRCLFSAFNHILSHWQTELLNPSRDRGGDNGGFPSCGSDC